MAQGKVKWFGEATGDVFIAEGFKTFVEGLVVEFYVATG